MDNFPPHTHTQIITRRVGLYITHHCISEIYHTTSSNFKRTEATNTVKLKEAVVFVDVIVSRRLQLHPTLLLRRHGTVAVSAGETMTTLPRQRPAQRLVPAPTCL